MNPLIDLAPKLIDLWNFYSDIYVGKENKIFDNSLTVLSERYDIVLSRCEGLLNIIEKERALAFSLNDRYKKSDDCIKIIGNTLDSICEKLGV